MSKRLLYPFYHPARHAQILDRWWVRLALVVYICAAAIAPLALFDNYMKATTGWCFAAAELMLDNPDMYRVQNYIDRLDLCTSRAREEVPVAIATAMIGTVVGHYVLQLVLFKVLIDFIVLGYRGRQAT